MEKGTSEEVNLLINILSRMKPSQKISEEVFNGLALELRTLAERLHEGESIIKSCDIVFRDGQQVNFKSR